MTDKDTIGHGSRREEKSDKLTDFGNEVSLHQYKRNEGGMREIAVRMEARHENESEDADF